MIVKDLLPSSEQCWCRIDKIVIVIVLWSLTKLHCNGNKKEIVFSQDNKVNLLFEVKRQRAWIAIIN